MRTPRLNPNLFLAALTALAVTAPALAQAQQAKPLIVRTYEVGDLVVNVPDYAISSSGRGASNSVGSAGAVGFGGGGIGGGGMGGGAAENPPSDPTTITLDSLIDAMVSCVSHDTWNENGTGPGEVQPVGTSLVVAQTQEVHAVIEDFFQQLRSGSGNRKTLAIDARWLLLNSDEVDQLIGNADDGKPKVNRKLLAELTRRPTSLRAMTNCFSGQRVYLISGTRRNVVSGYIPVVGSVERPDDVQLAERSGHARIVFAQFASGGESGGGRESGVGYQPIIEKPNFGALLEIRPTLMQGESVAVVDLKSTLTFPSDASQDSSATVSLDRRPAPAASLAPQVDRLAVEELELATTLRVPLGEPVLAGGMTYLAPTGSREVSAPAPAPSDVEQRQLYLMLEVR